MKLGPQKHFGAKSQSEWTIQLVPKARKMAIIIPRRRRGTREGVPVATWCSEWICRTGERLGPHILIFSASLSPTSLLPMRGAAIGRAPTILDSFYTRISNLSNLQFCRTLVLDSGITFHVSHQWNQTRQKMIVTLPPTPICTNIIEVL